VLLLIELLFVLVILLLLGVPLWIRPASRFYINPVSFFVHFKATTTRPRRVVFSVLLVWGAVDASRGFHEGWISSATLGLLWGGLVMSIGTLLLSLCWNLFFMGLVAIVWDWAARRWKNRATRN